MIHFSNFGRCSWCNAGYHFKAKSCPDCLYPYHNIDYLKDFDDIKAFHFHQPVGFSWFQDYEAKLDLTRPCLFCGGDAYFSINSFSVIEDGAYRDVCEISCKSCTNSTPYLFLYDFDQHHSLLLNAWNKRISRLPLIRYSDLKRPFYPALSPIKRITCYSKGLYKNPKPAQNQMEIFL